MTSKTDQILNHVITVKEDISGIKQHLKDINGTISRHENDISNVRMTIYKWGGAFSAILIIVQAISFWLL